jgi:Beta/Gamma crystallin
MPNRISSVRPMGYIPPPQPPVPNAQITLFTQENYLGNPTSYTQARPNIVKPAQSATVGAGSWQLCDGPNYTGRCIVLNQSVWELSNYNIGRTIRSVRPN